MTAEWRDGNGNPVFEGGPMTRPRCSVNSPISGTLDQSTDNSVGKRVNDALPWVVLSTAFGFLGFGGMIAVALLKPWEAEGRAVKAELRAEFAQILAQQQSAIERAKEDAGIAKDWTDQKNAELKIYRGAK